MAEKKESLKLARDILDSFREEESSKVVQKALKMAAHYEEVLQGVQGKFVDLEVAEGERLIFPKESVEAIVLVLPDKVKIHFNSGREVCFRFPENSGKNLFAELLRLLGWQYES
jgi:hypothetical protein